ncbi:hypothetical protein E2C01_019666 [Portunus trituberculatus]|uniref:Uncharacterized protein n=1 Tax=Portunus trituberculatus TaxID=210409 RepID=A0A5B7E003_PORTR|nr:hypothetical protein [Portunus trituberculatus]
MKKSQVKKINIGYDAMKILTYESQVKKVVIKPWI